VGPQKRNIRVAPWRHALASAFALHLMVAPASAQVPLPAGERRPWLALDVEGGAGYRTGANQGFAPVARGGVGAAVVDDRGFAALTGTAGYNPRPMLTFGLSAEAVSFNTGLGVSAAGTLDTGGVLGLALGPSLSLLRLQGQCTSMPRARRRWC